jgi:glutamate dehydrogenase
VVHSLGPTFASRGMAGGGAPAEEVVRAFRIAVEVTGAGARWRAVEGVGREVAIDVAWELMDGVDWLVEAVARWYLVHHTDSPMERVAAAGRAGLERLERVLPGLGSDEWRADREERAARLRAAGVPETLAREQAFQAGLAHVPDMVLVSRATGRDVEEVGEAFYRMGDGVRLEWLEAGVLAFGGESRTQRWATQALLQDLLTARRELAHRALVESPGESPADAVDAFLRARTTGLARYEAFLRSLNRDGSIDLAGMALASRSLRALVD